MITTFLGRTAAGEAVETFHLTNRHGLSMDVLTYGGIIQALRVPDAEGRLADIVLGLPRWEEYLVGHPYFGSIIGRVAGRIKRGLFLLDEHSYSLAVNAPPNHMHGGLKGLDKRVWTPEKIEDGVRLRYLSPDGEEGYPGNIQFTVTYRLTDDNELVIDSEAETDRPTPVSLANHSYFNLAGEGRGTVEDHVVRIAAEHFVPADAHLTLHGVRTPVDGLACDLREPQRLGDVLPWLHLNHGDHYLLPPSEPGELKLAAELIEPQSGRRMTVLTDEDCLQFNTGSLLDGSVVGKSHRVYGRHAGLCFKCQGYPDGVAHPELGDILVLPDKPRRRRTVFRFECAESQ